MRTQSRHFDQLLQNLNYLSAKVQAAGVSPPAVPPPARRAAVVCWDLSHNPVGRAHVLCKLLEPRWKVRLIGPIWRRFGNTLWGPLLNENLTYDALNAQTLTDLWREGAAVALAYQFDVVIVSKPRLPCLILGLLLAEQSRCPLLFDFDEDERAFLSHHPEDPAGSLTALMHEPFGTSGTLLASQYWSMADAVTVASPLLQSRLGGHLVRHARDEKFQLADRTAARRRLGYARDDLVLAFIGTARAHKGLDQVLTAMRTLGDARVKLMVVGDVADAGLLKSLQECDPAQVAIHGPCDIGALSRYLAAADLAPLLQDTAAVVSQSQFPAKLTDAIQHGVKVVATDAPPLREIGMSEAVDLIAPDGLAAYLASRLKQSAPVEMSAKIRRIFEDEFSLAVNRARLDAAIGEAQTRSNPFSRKIPNALQALAEATRRAAATYEPAPTRRGPRRDSKSYDVAFFWKQNDSDLFGRRPDMIAKHLLSSGRVRRLVHFDHPVLPTDLRRMAVARVRGDKGVSAMQFPNTIARMLHLSDAPAFTRRLFVAREKIAAPTFAGQALASSRSIGDFVVAALREGDCDPQRTIAWVCPIVRGFAEIDKVAKFRKVVVDLIDDERSGAGSPAYMRQLQTEYEWALHRADLVLTNAEGNRDRFSAIRPDIDIHVIPNGAELEPPPESTLRPEFLKALRHPAIGYVGSMRDRIDWRLLLSLAVRRPEWDFVLIGPWDEASLPGEIKRLENVILTGPLEYDVARLCLRSFDCAIVPHTCDAMTDAMNPLKIYNYLVAGLPVVTTPVNNLHGIREMVNVASDAIEFEAAIARALEAEGGGGLKQKAQLQHLSWELRTDEILALMDRWETEAA